MKGKVDYFVKTILDVIKCFSESSKQGFVYALFFSLNLISIFNPISSKNVAVKKFTRTFGAGIKNNWDCSKVIFNFYFWTILFIIIFFGCWVLFNIWKKNVCKYSIQEKEAVNFLDDLMIIGCINVFFKSPNIFSNSGIKDFLFSYSNLLINFFVITTFVYLILHISEKISFDLYFRIIISIFSFSFCINTFFAGKHPKKVLIIVLFLLTVLVIFSSIIIKNYIKRSERHNLLSSMVKSCSVIFCFFPLITSLFFELLNVLNSHNIFITRVRYFYICASLLLLLSTAILTIIIYTRKLSVCFWKRISYPILLIGLAALSEQPSLSKIYSVNMFESANLSIPVSNFLYFGKIPIVTCYPGHMMTGVWQAFVYAFFNNDRFGAILSPYAAWIEFPLISILFFYFIKTILDDNSAFITALIFPFSVPSCWTYFGMGMLLYISVIQYMRKQTLVRAFLIWTAFIWCALYRLDLGFAFFSASFMTVIIWCIQKKDKESFYKIFISFISTVLLCFVIWCILCIRQNVNPFFRLIEFLKLSASNQTWAYPQIGSHNSNIFIYGYMVVPFIMGISLLVCIFSKKLKNCISLELQILLLILGFSYFFNLPRGLVRHSLAENAISIVLWDSSVFIAVFFSIFLDKRKLFLPLLTSLVIFTVGSVRGSGFSEKSIFDNVFPKIQQSLKENRSHKIERTRLTQKDKEYCESYKFVMDMLLKDDETYIDFMNKTFVYSAIGRECPVYVAQSPLMLSGEFTQDMFIKEIYDRIENIPIAILPLDDYNAASSLDGILNSYRYYKVSEFLFSHYRPLFAYKDFSVWALNERYEELYEKCGLYDDYVADDIDSLFTGIEFDLSKNLFSKTDAYCMPFHVYDIGYLPYLWAEKAVSRYVVKKQMGVNCTKKENVYCFSSEAIKKSKGNYLYLKISNFEETNRINVNIGKCTDYDFIPEYSFNFKILDGENDYLIRISADNLWYFENINAFKVDGDCSILEARILEGD